MGALRVCAAAFVAGLIVVPAADAQTRLVTYAARACPTYADVTANLARNDIQESLRDLGADTLYASGEPISAAKEQQGQPNCRPLADWRFVLGTGYRVPGGHRHVGVVVAASRPRTTPSIVTKASTPLLNRIGDPIGVDLPGAVTVALTHDQAQRSQQGNSLWLQGGAVDDPVLDELYPGQYGFAALRCAVDNLNGDNVEWIGFPNGVTHVLCYAYYVSRRPPAARSSSSKVVDAPDATAHQDFSFTGNISYTEDNRFTLSASNGSPAYSETFFRAAGATPWTFAEEVPPGWSLTGLACTSANRREHDDDLARERRGARHARAVGHGHLYLHEPAAAARSRAAAAVQAHARRCRELHVRRRRVDESARQTITTTRARRGGPRRAARGHARRVHDHRDGARATTRAGRWSPSRAPSAARNRFDPLEPVTLTIPAGAGVACEFTNRFIPAGVLRIRKVAIGGTGTAHFQITPRRGAAVEYHQSAIVRRQLVPVRARGDDTTQLPLGTYDILEFGPPGDRGRALGAGVGAVRRAPGRRTRRAARRCG